MDFWLKQQINSFFVKSKYEIFLLIPAWKIFKKLAQKKKKKKKIR